MPNQNKQSDQSEKRIYDIYDSVLDFCESRGFIKALGQSFLMPEVERFANRNIEKSGLDILDAVHCIVDKKKAVIFLTEIFNAVNDSDIVLEAGIGTGLLSFVASIRSKKVYGLEINPATLELANEIKDHLTAKGLINPTNIEFILADATTYVSPEKVDIIISENLYTGMLLEQQVQILNNLIHFIKPEGIIVPSKLLSFVSIGETQFPITPSNNQVFVPAEMNNKMHSEELSHEIQYDEIDFGNIRNSGINCNIPLEINKTGYINSAVIFSEVVMPSGRKIKRHDADFLNDDIVVAIDPVQAQQGDDFILHLEYKYGCKTQDLHINLVKDVVYEAKPDINR